jgi:hypothetical protein
MRALLQRVTEAEVKVEGQTNRDHRCGPADPDLRHGRVTQRPRPIN